MLIVEELYLLLTSDKGTQEAAGTQRDHGMCAALITDLVLAGRITISEDKEPRVHVISAEATGHPVLDFGLERVQLKDGKRLDSLVTWSKLDPYDVVIESLVQAGVLAYGERTMLGLGKPRTPEVDPGPERALRARLAAVIAGSAAPTPGDATLLAILQSLEVAERILAVEIGDLRGRQLKDRINAVVESSAAGDTVNAVSRAVQALDSDTIMGAVAAVIVAGTSS